MSLISRIYKTNENEIYNILQIPKICTCIKCGNEPSIINENVITDIKLILGHAKDIDVETDFEKGEQVRVVYGSLAGCEGVLIKRKGKNRLGIQIQHVNQMIVFEVCSNIVKRVK